MTRLWLRIWVGLAACLGMRRLVWTSEEGGGWRCRAPGIAEASGATGLEALQRLVSFGRRVR